MKNSIIVYATSKDSDKIAQVKKWIRQSRILHKDRLISPIYVPNTVVAKMTPDKIAAYASAINTIFPNERVTDYNQFGFVTVKKEAFPKVCRNCNFYDPCYKMELDDLGWHIVPNL